MSKSGFSMGFKPKSLPSKAPPKPKLAPSRIAFGSNDDSDDDTPQPAAFTSKATKSKPTKPPSPKIVAITEFDYDASCAPAPREPSPPKHSNKTKKKLPPLEPPVLKSKSKEGAGTNTFGNMSSSLTSRKNLNEAQALDPTIFDYDNIYDTLKQTSKPAPSSADGDGPERNSRYMKSLLASSTIRTRDRQIAEEKKTVRERAAEGDLYADKEAFVTAAYKKQQEDNARVAEEEKLREEQETKKNANGGMTSFYKKLLEEDEKRHERMVKAVEEVALKSKLENTNNNNKEKDSTEQEENKNQQDMKGKGKQGRREEEMESDLARKINNLGGNILLNDDGEVVDKRELLRGGLNVAPKKRHDSQRNFASSSSSRMAGGSGAGGGGSGSGGGGGGKAAMRERQSRMIENRLAQQMKRSLEREDEETARVERAAKSRKTDVDISSAKERYLARKKAAAAEKEMGGV